MKRISIKARGRNVFISLGIRTGKIKNRNRHRNRHRHFDHSEDIEKLKKWLREEEKLGLHFHVCDNKSIVLYLPAKMDFAKNYDITVQYIAAIRTLAGKQGIKRQSHYLGSVNFDGLEKISTSAALVLTAELSKWDDILKKRVKPNVANWNVDILQQFYDLGFFDLFNNSPFEGASYPETHSEIRLVKYIKGRCGDSRKARVLRAQLREVIGEDIDKWMFLRSGLDEAVTNVSHHAYPINSNRKEREKTWYLSGSYNQSSKELKIVFYDQGIGIPKSLPSTEFGEKLLKLISEKFSFAEGRQHAVMLKAAIALARTRTADIDRGKGLQDLLEFIKQRRNGYISILSLKGLYKYTEKNGKVEEKSTSFNRPIEGTLIIWCVNLD